MIEVCMGMENHTEMWFSWESHENGHSHMAYTGNGIETGEKVYKRLYRTLTTAEPRCACWAVYQYQWGGF